MTGRAIIPTSHRRSVAIAAAHNAKLAALVETRRRQIPGSGVTDGETWAFLAVLEAAEATIKSMRVAKLAAVDDPDFAWRRRLGAWSHLLDALVEDFRTGGTAATDEIHYRLTATPEE